MSERLKLIVAYDGASFAGWQSQRHGNTIQDHLERAVARVSGERVRVHGAGRTDASVHALAQCAHVDLNSARPTVERWPAALNASLPPTIRVLRCSLVSEKFHARYSAKSKTYRYRIWTGPVLPPHELNRAWHVPGPIDFEPLRVAARKFIGTHDFAGFAANRGKSPSRRDLSRARSDTNTIRTIRSVGMRRKGALVEIDFEADGFLYKMVRLMVGAIVDVALGKNEPEEISKRLRSPHHASVRFAAPAAGLFLVRVGY
jgi:tRNA pseudouridine38-40 synthase